MVLYTLLAYLALPAGKEMRRTCEVMQRLCMAVFTINSFLTMAIMAQEDRAQGCPRAKTRRRATVSLAPEDTPRI